MAKLYHADQDPSPYAEMRYKEIRAAYDVLKQKAKNSVEKETVAHSSPPPSPPKNTNYGAERKRQHASAKKDYRTVCGKNWQYNENSEDNKFDMGDMGWDVKYESRKYPDDRLPFSLRNLPDIFSTSFNEVFGAGMTIRVLLVALGLWLTLASVGWPIVWRAAAISCILIASLLYRYYFSSHSDFVAILLCSLVLSFICVTITNPTIPLPWTVMDHSETTAWRRVYRTVYVDGGNAFAVLSMVIFTLLFVLCVRPMNWLKSLTDQNVHK